jgi:zinc protease
MQKLDRTKHPKTGKPKDVKFPNYYETHTENGITIIVVQDKRVPLVTSRLVFKSGSCYDSYFGKNKSGLASLTSELLSKGTPTMNASKIAEEVDYRGAVLLTGCDYDASYVSSYSLKKHFDKIFHITSDVVLNSVFAEEEITRLKQQRINSLLSYMDEGDYLADKTFNKIVYGDTPYSNPVEGTEGSINDLVRDDFINFHKTHYVPNNLIIAFVGDIEINEAEEFVSKNFSDWNSKMIEEINIPDILLSKEVKTYIIEKEGAVQSDIHLGHLGISRNNPDFVPVMVMNTILGGYFTSRINKNLREIHGYTYGATSIFNWRKFNGDFSVETDVKNSVTLKAIKEIIKELKKIKEEKISSEELYNVKNYISGNFPLQLETPNAIATKVINLKLYDIESDYYDKYISKVNALGVEDLHVAADKYLHPDNLTIAVAGSTKDIKEDLKQLGSVEVIEKVE